MGAFLVQSSLVTSPLISIIFSRVLVITMNLLTSISWVLIIFEEMFSMILRSLIYFSFKESKIALKTLLLNWSSPHMLLGSNEKKNL